MHGRTLTQRQSQGEIFGMRYTISQAARAAGVTPRAARLYESKGLCGATDRSAAGYRMFTDTDVANLRFVRCARHLGLSLDAIAEIMTLADEGASPCERACALLAQRVSDIDEAMSDLQHLRERIVSALTADVERAGSERCAIIEHAVDSN